MDVSAVDLSVVEPQAVQPAATGTSTLAVVDRFRSSRTTSPTAVPWAFPSAVTHCIITIYYANELFFTKYFFLQIGLVARPTRTALDSALLITCVAMDSIAPARTRSR